MAVHCEGSPAWVHQEHSCLDRSIVRGQISRRLASWQGREGIHLSCLEPLVGSHSSGRDGERLSPGARVRRAEVWLSPSPSHQGQRRLPGGNLARFSGSGLCRLPLLDGRRLPLTELSQDLRHTPVPPLQPHLRFKCSDLLPAVRWTELQTVPLGGVCMFKT